METETQALAHKKKVITIPSVEWHIIKKSLLVVAVILVLILLDSTYGFISVVSGNAGAKGKLQAVFLTNNQIYFGHLAPYGMDTYILRGAYYVRSTQVPVTPSLTGNDSQKDQQYTTQNELVPVTQDSHGPEDTLYIPARQILFWQNLRSDSVVARTILSAPR